MFFKTKHSEDFCGTIYSEEEKEKILSLGEIISKCNARMAKHVRWKRNYKTDDHCLGW